jgi:WD40-like Beta Propeller Repeat
MPRLITRLSLGPVLLAVSALLVVGAPAQAAFPGANGRIAFDSDLDDPGVQSEVYVASPDGSGLTRLTNNPASDSDAGWSPDGSRITFASNGDGNYEIYVMNADGSGQTRLTDNPAFDADPSWSPDGTQIVFASDRKRGANDFDIYRMNADGTGQTALTTNSYFEAHPAWSPDGSKIAYQGFYGGDSEILTMNADGSGGIDITNNPARDDRPNWSPNGTQIAFASDRSGGGDIYKMNADGSSQTNLSTSSNQETAPAWSPDGTRVAEVVGNELHTLSAAGGDEQKVTGPLGTFMANPDWEPVSVAGYPRPKGATPIRVSLVPAYLGCSNPNKEHGGALAGPSCGPPTQLSQYLTVGAGDANGVPANSVGSVRLDAVLGNPSTPANEADVKLATRITDARVRGDLSDYTGELMVSIGLRITDKYNGPSLAESATVSDNALSWAVPCVATADTGIGSTCALNTTMNAVVSGTVREEKRSNWALGQVQVSDGGEDGQAATTGDNTPFMKQGIFVP